MARKMPESVKKMLAARKRKNPGGKRQRDRGTRDWRKHSTFAGALAHRARAGAKSTGELHAVHLARVAELRRQIAALKRVRGRAKLDAANRIANLMREYAYELKLVRIYSGKESNPRPHKKPRRDKAAWLDADTIAQWEPAITRAAHARGIEVVSVRSVLDDGAGPGAEFWLQDKRSKHKGAIHIVNDGDVYVVWLVRPWYDDGERLYPARVGKIAADQAMVTAAAPALVVAAVGGSAATRNPGGKKQRGRSVREYDAARGPTRAQALVLLIGKVTKHSPGGFDVTVRRAGQGEGTLTAMVAQTTHVRMPSGMRKRPPIGATVYVEGHLTGDGVAASHFFTL